MFFDDFIKKDKIKVKIINKEKSFEHSFQIEKTAQFTELENLFYQKESKLMKKKINFIYNTKEIDDKNKTIEDIGIIDGSIIIIIIESIEITVKIKSSDQKINEDFKIKDTDNFNKLENMLISKYNNLKNQKLNFFANANLIDKSKAIYENDIKDKDVILVIIESNEITVKIKSTDQKINEDFKIQNTDNFILLENKLIQKYSYLKNQNLKFLIGASLNLIDKSKTINENNIKDKDAILVIIESNKSNEPNEITVKIKSSDQKINEDFKIKITEKFNEFENMLIQKYNSLKNQNLYFLVNGNLIDKSKTFDENGIKDGNFILVIIEQPNDNKNNINNNNSNEIISVIIMPVDQSFDHLFEIKKTEQFDLLANELYQKETSLKNKNHYFVANGIKIDTSKTIEDNGINDKNVILFIDIDSTMNLDNLSIIKNEKILLTIKSDEFSHDFICEKTDKFDKFKKELYEKESGLNDKDYYFLFDGKEIDTSKTIEEINIKNNDVITIMKKMDDILNDINDESISIKIEDSDKNFSYDFNCKKNDKIEVLEDKLLNIDPKLKDKNYYLTFNNNKIDVSKTIEESGIKNKDVLIFKEEEWMALIIMDEENKTFSFVCKDSDPFSELEKKFYKNEPKYMNENHKFYIDNKEIDISKTLKENNITDGCIIYYKKVK